MKQIEVFIVILIMLRSFTGLSQNVEESTIRQVTPLTPNAASLGKFGDVPVSLYTGIPNVNIPLYEIKVGGFVLPISMAYHAGGVQVDDVPSWVGTGWTLSAGGMINRRMRGVEDYRMVQSKELFYDRIEVIEDPLSTTPEKLSAASDLYYGKYDTESDIFSISTGSLSHQFFLDVDGEAHGKPARKLNIIPEGSVSLNQGNHVYYARWRVTDENGVEYIFGRTIDDANDYFEITKNETACGATSGAQEFVNTWYLNQIKLPDGESIFFTYDYFSTCRENTISASLAVNPDFVLSKTSKTFTNHLRALRIKEISFPSGKIVFVPGDDRYDLQGDKVLDQIKIFSKRSGNYFEEKSFRLSTNNSLGDGISSELFRLALLSITEFDADGIPLEPYAFEYRNQSSEPVTFGLPGRGSYAQDLWGYYNGKTSNYGLIPSFVYLKEGRILDVIDGADRSVDTEKAQAGILQKVTYPTGGTTEFFYESNVAKGIDHEDLAIGLHTIHKTSTAQLENIGGYNDGYGPSFEVSQPDGESVHVNAEIQYLNGNECLATMSAYGSFFDCLAIILEKRGVNGQFVVSENPLYFDQDYLLSPGEYRVKITWNSPLQAGAIAKVHLTWDELSELPTEEFVNPAETLAALGIVQTGTKGNHLQLLNTNGTDSGFGPVFHILKPGLVNVTFDSHVMYDNSGNTCTVTTPVPGSGSFYECFTISLEKKNMEGEFDVANSTVYFDRIYALDRGEYRIKISWHDPDQIGSWAYVDLQWSDYLLDLPLLNDPNREFTVGGLRIAKLVDTDDNSGLQIVRWFDYNYDESDQDEAGAPLVGTSGFIQNAPLHQHSSDVYVAGTLYSNQDILTSFSNSSILQTSGGYVGYGKVTVSFGADKGGGKQVSYFTSPADHPDGNLTLTQSWPQLYENVDVDWRRGLKERVIDLKYENDVYSSVHQIENSFEFLDDPTDPNNYYQLNVRVAGLVMDFSTPVTYWGGGFLDVGDVIPLYSIYKTVSEAFYMDQSIEHTKAAQGDIIVSSIFEQNPYNLAVSKTITSDSRGGLTEVVSKYPVDYGNIENINALKAANIISLPIKTETIYNGNLVSGTVVKYTDFGQPQEVYRYEHNGLGAPSGHNTNMMIPSNYYLKSQFYYDPEDHRLSETLLTAGIPITYLWGYDRSFPVAKIENLTTAQVPPSVIASIEAHVFTGGLEASDFKSDVQFLNDQLSSLRNSDKCRVTTFTFNTLFGLTSQTDSNGMTTYFEKDGFGRLHRVKDDDENVVTSIDYHYEAH